MAPASNPFLPKPSNQHPTKHLRAVEQGDAPVAVGFEADVHADVGVAGGVGVVGLFGVAGGAEVDEAEGDGGFVRAAEMAAQVAQGVAVDGDAFGGGGEARFAIRVEFDDFGAACFGDAA